MPPRAERVFLFAGPSLAPSARARRLARRCRLRPPVRRFDVAKLVEKERRPGVMVIADGVFHDSLAVGHAEIREAMRSGWRVWGLSSMGAIRASEMIPLGMRGYGRVFERFAADPDFADDEVALLHEPGPPYRAASEPLVHLREAVTHVVAEGLVPDADGREVIASLKSRWYGERTVRGATEELARRAPSDTARAAVRREMKDFARFRVKTGDLEAFLEERPWEMRAANDRGNCAAA